jgi:hypothetical protein
MRQPRIALIVVVALTLGAVAAIVVQTLPSHEAQPPRKAPPKQGAQLPRGRLPPSELQPPSRRLYVATSGSDASQCTSSAPCRSLDRADQLATPGTLVEVAPGRYRPAVLQRSGTPSARIGFVSTVPWGARVSAGSGSAILVEGAYVDVGGFNVTGGPSLINGIALVGDHSAAIGNEVHDIPGPCRSNGGIVAGDSTYSTRDMVIAGNWVHDIGTGPRNGSCHLLHGIYAAVPGVRIANNVVARVIGDGITSWHAATHMTVVNNTAVDNGAAGILIGNGDAGSTSAGNTDTYVANNVLAGNAQVAIVQGGPRGVHNTYRDNSYFDNGRDGVLYPGDSVVVGSLIGPPGFVAPEQDDYRLVPGSINAGSGTVAGAPEIDFLGCVRRGGGVSRGAYQAETTLHPPGPPGRPPTAAALAAFGLAAGGDPTPGGRCPPSGT